MEKRMLIKKRRFSKDAAYALFLGTGVLCILSFLSLSALALARFKLDQLGTQSQKFYGRLHSDNEKVLAEWKNLSPESEGEKSGEND